MPSAAARPCAHPGCGVLVRNGGGRCPAHKRANQKEADSRRGTSVQRGYGYKWQKAREDYLRSNPLCVECERQGKVAAASVVDHIVPHKGDMELFWDSNNWQPLCKLHHDRKTAAKDGGFGNG